MANSKISALTAATTPVAGTEVLPIVQSSATKQVSIANLTAGRSVSAADYVMTTGNLVPSTAAKGINFTANTAAAGMSSQLLNWYEEGTWTPNVGGTAVYAIQTGRYTRIGRQVTVACDLSITALGTGSAKNVSGLPFTPNGIFSGSMGYMVNLNGTYVMINPIVASTTYVYFETMTAAANVTADNTSILTSGTRIIFTLTYFI
jgi:hypothetical protein